MINYLLVRLLGSSSFILVWELTHTEPGVNRRITMFHKAAGASSKRNTPEDSCSPVPMQNTKKLKGDEEFEKQIAMAITATDMIASRDVKNNEGTC